MTKRLKLIKRYTPLYVMMLPGLLYLLINNYLPMAGIVTAFKDIDYRKGIFGSDWIGFKNFEYLFATQDAFIITRTPFVTTLHLSSSTHVVCGCGHLAQ